MQSANKNKDAILVRSSFSPTASTPLRDTKRPKNKSNESGGGPQSGRGGPRARARARPSRSPAGAAQQRGAQRAEDGEEEHLGERHGERSRLKTRPLISRKKKIIITQLETATTA